MRRVFRFLFATRGIGPPSGLSSKGLPMRALRGFLSRIGNSALFLIRVANYVRTRGLRKTVDRLVVRYLEGLKFANRERSYVRGPADRLHIADSRRPSGSRPRKRIDAVFNTASGHIYIEEDVSISHGCMFLTGRHEYEGGQKKPRPHQVPNEGHDIRVGEGSFIAAGVIVIGGVTIGAHCIVYAGSVVTKDIPDGSIAAGVPAKIIGRTP